MYYIRYLFLSQDEKYKFLFNSYFILKYGCYHLLTFTYGVGTKCLLNIKSETKEIISQVIIKKSYE